MRSLLPRLTRPRPLRSILSLGLLAVPAVALASGPVPRITQPVNSEQRVTLQGNVRPLPARARDLGEVAPATPANRVHLLLQRSPEQEAALETFITDVHTPGNPEYHQWMTPTQFGAEFGPADSDVQAVVAWLESQGFAVARVNAAKTAIEFSGTAAQLESAFATRIHSFQLDGVNHVANVTDPQIPAALKPVVAGLSPLNDFRARPMHSAPRAAASTPAPTADDPHAHSIRPVASPDLNSPSGGRYVVPADAATIYDVPNASLNPAFHGTSLTGSGVSIGIAGTSNVDLSNVANYRSLFGLPALTPTVIVDGTDPGVLGDNAVEALLDLEVASAFAPQANLNLYIAQSTSFQDGLFLAIQRALDDNVVSILNVSFGSCEAFQGQAGNQTALNFWQQAAAQGISVTVSTGDSGAAGCDSADATQAVTGLQVNGLASTPYNIAVGGTDFNQTASNEATYWNTTNGANYGSAKGYIPEIPWNNSTSTIGPLSGNVASRDTNSQTRIDGAGGGVSGCLAATLDNAGNLVSCSGAYAKPSWQTNNNVARTLPDVSLFAANGGHDSAWVLCASGLGGETSGTDCVRDSTGAFNLQLVGGTSASAPAFAGVLALVTQQLEASGYAVRLGQADYTLYPLAAQHASVFHDVTTGNISVVCKPNTLNCGANGFLTGYDASAGYDLASGLGSMDVAQLVQNWSAITFKPTSTALTLNGGTAPITLKHGTAVSVGVTVSSSGGTPTGSVALEAATTAPNSVISPVDGATPSPSIFTLSNGTAGGNYPYLPGGTYAVKANYAGDGTFGSSVSNGVNVTVTPEPSVLGLFAQVFAYPSGKAASASTAGSIPYGTYVSVAAQPVSSTLPANATYAAHATGTVAFSSSSPLLNVNVPIDSNGLAEIPNQANLAYPPGTYSVSATYPGDLSFTGSSAAAVGFTIVKNNVNVSSAAGTGGATVVEVDPASGNLYFNPGASLPTGTVTLLSSSGTTVGTGTLAPVNTSQGQVAQATVAGAAFASISYSGDNNYNSGTVASTPSFALAATGGTLTVTRGASGTSTVSITPQAGFTGTVNLTCAVTGAGTPLPTCSLAQATVTLSGTAPASDVLTVRTTSGSAALHLPTNPATAPRGTWYAAGGVTLAGLLLLGVPGRRRQWQRMLGLVLFVTALGLAGCGGSSGGGSGSSGTTPAGSYVVTVTATSGTVTQTTNVTVTVQ